MGAVHTTAFELIHRSGVLHLKRRLKPRTAPVVLGYHQLDTPPFLNELMGWSMSPDHFHAQITYLKKHLPILSAAELSDLVINGKQAPDNAVAITFDDGYADVYTVALPILKKLNVPAMVFVSTGAVDEKRSIWTNRVYYFFSKTRKTQVSLTLPDGTLTGARWRNPLELRRGILQIMSRIKQQPADDVPKILSILASALGVDRNLDPWQEMPMLSWDQIRALHTSKLVTIAAHTVDHPILARCTVDRQRREIERSRSRIEDEIGTSCDFIAYPNGQHNDIDCDTVEIVKDVGFKTAWMFTPTPRYPDDLTYNAPRHPIMTSKISEFAWALR